MVDITHKTNTLRIATAEATVLVSKLATIEAIIKKQVPKGDVFEMAKAAGLLAVKKTPDLLPDCHPIPIEYTGVNYKIEGLTIIIEVTIKTIYKTGVEVEAMHGASVVALTFYDMLKPIDKGVEIHQIRLLHKSGGKSDRSAPPADLKTAVVVCSDRLSEGIGTDRSGARIVEKLETMSVAVHDLSVVPDVKEDIQDKIRQLTQASFRMILLTGGTGLSHRDVTPEAVRELLDREIPGIAETARQYGQSRMPLAMLSRSVAGLIGDTLVIAMPGSTGGVTEYMDALFPQVFHLFGIIEGQGH
ncbi:bifunctional molybdenum cofactor biosynthesis protein MoaC/MoaB [Dyadobacter jejuensis]|nr:bifunctional molybdenum cofactor biosynthesis protein MoaC/MoaB [Dyadobacter jejuensis]